MIGLYNYTVWLTYLSFISAGVGIFMTLAEDRPLFGVLCLLISGLCDAFDGKVASTKKDRSDFQKKYGIQIDSLSDVVAFGVLPAVIGVAEFKLYLTEWGAAEKGTPGLAFLSGAVYVIAMAYMLAAYIRLAYFNVSEEERQKTEKTARKTYLGIPVTAAALVYPLLFIFQTRSDKAFIIAYFFVMLLMTFGFLVKIKVKKPSFRALIIMTVIGAVEFALLMLFKLIL